MTKLQRLSLIGNQLSALPEQLRELRNLKAIYLHENDALGLPVDIMGPTDRRERGRPASPADILAYYFEMRLEARPLNEVKLLIVGRGRAGKTSVIRRLREGKFTARSRETKGIEIKPWLLNVGSAKIKVRTWDFAGQVITHATHQFFLSQRSLYVLVLTGRENSEQSDLSKKICGLRANGFDVGCAPPNSEYWLKLIQAFGTEGLEHADSRESKKGSTAPVIVALNKCRSSPCNLDREKLREKYPFIVDFVETDCKPGTGIRKLHGLIVRTIFDMESVRKSFPKSWFSIYAYPRDSG